MRKYRSDDFEFTAREVSFFDAVEEQLASDQQGVLVEASSPAVGPSSARSRPAT